jgi:hypothetical protein
MATFLLHSHAETGRSPSEDEMVNSALRAKYELNRLPEIHRDLMDEGERNPFRAYRIAERLASIEGRLKFEVLKRGGEPLLPLSYAAKKELAVHKEQTPQLSQELQKTYSLSKAAAQHSAMDILRYRETHGENPSEGQMSKMLQISREVENKEYPHLSPHQNAAEIAFLRRREGDLLFKHGLAYDASRDLVHSQRQVQKSFELIQRQMAIERQHSKQMDMGL